MKHKNDYILILLSIFFILIFKYNVIVKESVIESTKIWFYNLVPSMFIMYTITDLLINYGIIEKFRNKNICLIIISCLLGCPANAKYIKYFYDQNLISIDSLNAALYYTYSPNPMFLLSISPNFNFFIYLIFYIYLTNLLLWLIFNKRNQNIKITKNNNSTPFIKALQKSIDGTFKILLIVLGVVITFGILVDLLNIYFPNVIIISVILELTNAISVIISQNHMTLPWIILACSFGGLSIHMQIKSILEDTHIKYKNFILGRLFASIPIVIYILINYLI